MNIFLIQNGYYDNAISLQVSNVEVLNAFTGRCSGSNEQLPSTFTAAISSVFETHKETPDSSNLENNIEINK